jgi:hypothetical protein
MARAPSSAARKRLGARQRSEALLRELLGAEEHTRLMQRGYLEVRSPSHPGREYQIPQRGGFVTMLEHGEPVELLCIGPTEPLPPADVIAMHKLLIEADEVGYLRMANHFSPGFGDWPVAQHLARLTLTPQEV